MALANLGGNGLLELQLIYHTIHSFKVYSSTGFSVFTELCSHHHNRFDNIFVTSERNLVPFAFHINGVIQYVRFCVWRNGFRVSQYCSRCQHVLFWLNCIPLCGWTTFCHSLVDERSACFHFFGYCRRRCREHLGTSLGVDLCFHFSWERSKEWGLLGHTATLCLTF